MASNFGSSTEVYPTNQRRIVFLGRTGSGKSASGNNILGEKVFKSRISASSVTKKCQRGTAVRFGRNIQIIDTPGLFDTRMTNAEVTKEIVKCVGMTAPGPHAFVLVIRIDRHTEEEQNTVEHLMYVFGEGMVVYLMILFTRKDELIRDNSTLEEYLETVPEELQRVLQACNNRCLAFNNNGSELERDHEVEVFLKMIDDMLMQNENHFYTNGMFREAERAMQEREKQLLREDESVGMPVRKRSENKRKKERKIEDYRERARKEVADEHPGIMSKLFEHMPIIPNIMTGVINLILGFPVC